MDVNVKKYCFRDTDDAGDAEYDIVGDDYRRLIGFCCDHAAVFSVIATNDKASLLKKIAPYEITKPENITYTHEHYGDSSLDIRYYKVCPQLYDTIVSNTDNMFCWINGWGYCNPEDPVFFRKDGSVLFDSIIHDGECSLYIKDEDAGHIVCNPLWQATP